jgi:hypothetical protein
MGTVYYAVNHTKKEVFQLGKAYHNYDMPEAALQMGIEEILGDDCDNVDERCEGYTLVGSVYGESEHIGKPLYYDL